MTREGQVNGWFQNQQKPKLLEAARSDIGITAARDVRPNKYILQKIRRIDKNKYILQKLVELIKNYLGELFGENVTLGRGQDPLLLFQSHL